MISKPLIYAHRGFWDSPDQQNSLLAFQAAQLSGFGIETDVRSKNLSLVISHDPHSSEDSLELDEIELSDTPLALNIKEDGLLIQYDKFFQKYPNPHSFLFDGSIPEMLKMKKKSLPHALRLSEYETDLPWETRFIWMDGFHSDWWIPSDRVLKLLEKHFIIFVSPELHGRTNKNSWDYFLELHAMGIGEFGICTDHPDKLTKLFNE